MKVYIFNQQPKETGNRCEHCAFAEAYSHDELHEVPLEAGTIHLCEFHKDELIETALFDVSRAIQGNVDIDNTDAAELLEGLEIINLFVSKARYAKLKKETA